MYQSEEICGTCKYGQPDSEEGVIWCLCFNSPEYFEENRWNYNCDFWEGKDDS